MHNQNFCTISTTQLIPCCCSCALPSPPGSPVLSPLLIPKPQFPVNLFFSSFLSSFYFALVLPKISWTNTVENWDRHIGTDLGGSLGKQHGQQRTVPMSLEHPTILHRGLLLATKISPPENVAQVGLSSWKACTYTGRRIWAVQCPALQPHTLHGLCRCTQHTWYKEVTGVWELWITFSQAANT